MVQLEQLTQIELEVLKARIKGYYSPHLATQEEMIASARIDSLAGDGGLVALYDSYRKQMAEVAAQS